jgi:transcriptional regulator with XRE-family HTH domain
MGGIERGKRNPSLLVMARIAEAMSVPLARLLTECASGGHLVICRKLP